MAKTNVAFNDEDKQEMGGKYFEVGVHTALIMLVEFDETEDKDPRVFVEFTVTDPETQTKEAKVRLWFHTPGARKYSFNIIKGIFVHNSPEEKKQAIREKVDGVKDTNELAKLCELLVGKEAFLEISEDPVRTYENDKGEVKPSLNKNLTGYRPTPKSVSAPAAAPAAEPQNSANGDDDVMAGF